MATSANPTPITQLPVGSVQLTDVYPAVDVTDTDESNTGTTKKYTIADLKSTLVTTTYSNKRSCLVATTANLSATYSDGEDPANPGVGATLVNSGSLAAFSVDGVSPAINSRILVKDQTTTSQNGIYTLTTVGSGSVAWVLTRAIDYNAGTEAATPDDEINQGDFVVIVQGTTNALTEWAQTQAGPFTVGTTSIVFAAVDSSTIGGIIPLSKGGTNKNITADNGAIVYCDANSFELLASVATAGKVLQSGASSAPAWSTPTYPSASGSAGVILRSNGTNNVYSTSTFADTYTINTILYAGTANQISGLASANSALLTTNQTGVPALTGPFTNGQLIIGSTGARPVVANLTAGTGITISNSAGGITINSTGSGMATVEVTGTTQAMAINTRYIANNAALVTLTLPAVAAIGDTIIVNGKGAGGWRIAQNASGQINVGAIASTAGVGGHVDSTNRFDTITISCITANNIWTFEAGIGSYSIT